MADTDIAFAAWLRASRQAAGLSQQKVADALAEQGIKFHQTTIDKIERNERPMRLAEAVALVRLFGTTLDDALGMQSGPSSVIAEQAARRTVLLHQIRTSIDAEIGGA